MGFWNQTAMKSGTVPYPWKYPLQPESIKTNCVWMFGFHAVSDKTACDNTKIVHKFQNLDLQISGSSPDYCTLSKDKVLFLLFRAKNYNFLWERNFWVQSEFIAIPAGKQSARPFELCCFAASDRWYGHSKPASRIWDAGLLCIALHLDAAVAQQS